MFHDRRSIVRFVCRRTGLILGLALTLSLLASGPADAEWTRIGGPEPPVASALGVFDGLTLMGTNEADAGDVFASNDGGQTWFDAGLPNGGVNSVFGHSGVLFVGSYLDPLHRSTDGGETWVQATQGMQGFPIIATFTVSGNTIFACPGGLSTGPLYRSDNSGELWSLIAGTPSVEWVSSHTAASGIFAGSAQNGLYRSTNGGTSFQAIAGGIPSDARVGGLMEVGSTLYAGVSVASTPSVLGVYRSIDGGTSWTKISQDLPSSILLGFTSLHVDGTTFFAGLYGGFGGAGLYRSTNGGVNWTKVSNTLPTPGDSSTLGALSLVVEPGLVLLGTEEGVFRSSNQGDTWEDSNTGASAIRGIGSFLAEGSTLFAGLQTNGQQGRGLWRTTDAGDSWTKMGATTGLGDNAAVWALIRHEGDLFAGVYGSPRGVYRSSDDGEHWEFTSNGISNGTIIWDMQSVSGAMLVGAHEALYRSTNQGASWGSVSGMREVTCFAEFQNALFAGTEDSGVFRSTDAGATWTPADAGLPHVWIYDLNVSNGTLFAATNGPGVYRWNGSSWTPSGLGGGFILALQSVGSAMLASSALDGVFLSTNNGASWTPLNDGYWGGEVSELAWTDDHVWIGSRAKGVWSRPASEVLAAASAEDGGPAITAPSLTLLGANPIRGARASLRYTIAQPEALVRLDVFDVSGRSVLSHDLGLRAAGTHEFALDVEAWPAGVYLARLDAGKTTALRLVRLR